MNANVSSCLDFIHSFIQRNELEQFRCIDEMTDKGKLKLKSS